MPVGYFFGALNLPAKFIQHWANETLVNEYYFYLNETQQNVLWASIVSSYLFGGICGSFASAWSCDKFGRKATLIISSIIFIIAGILFTLCRAAKSLEMLLVARFLGGIASAFVFTAHPMYLLEIATPQLSCSVGVFTGIGVTGGILLAQITSLIFYKSTLWQFGLSFYSLITIICLLPLFFFPESPRWLYMLKSDISAAKIALIQLRGGNNLTVEEELLSMNNENITSAFEKKSTFCNVLGDSQLFLPLLIICSFQATQQLSGVNAIFYYSLIIFETAGFMEQTATWLNLGIGAFNFVVSILCSIWLIKLVGRRHLMLVSCFGCSLSLLCIAFGFHYVYLVQWLPYACISSIFVFLLFFQFGLSSVPFFIGSELLDISTRPIAMSMGSLFSWIGNFLIGMCFPLLEIYWGSFAFLPCCGVCIYCFLLTLFYMPETCGRNQKDLMLIMRNGLKSKIK